MTLCYHCFFYLSLPLLKSIKTYKNCFNEHNEMWTFEEPGSKEHVNSLYYLHNSPLSLKLFPL